METSELLSIVIALVIVGGIATAGLKWVRQAKGGRAENSAPKGGKK
jgi:hypothetical protein